MSYLYVNEQSARIGVDGGYITVQMKNDLLRKIPSETLENISLFGNVSITTQAMQRCLKLGITLNFFSSNGRYYGHLTPTARCRITRQRKQFAMTEEDTFVQAFTREILGAKIHNQKVVLKRYLTKQTPEILEAVKQIENAERKLCRCESLDEIKGYEGIAARYYFAALSEIIEPDFKFFGRNRMPPKDPFNSMLSLGYTLLMHEIYGLIEGHGLNAYAGFLHQDREKHPTLASDLMEEWRAVIVDSVVLSLIQGHEIPIDGFQDDHETGGILLMNDTFRIFVRKYEKKLRSEIRYLQSEGRQSYRALLNQQVLLFAKAIDEEDPEIYKAVRIR